MCGTILDHGSRKIRKPRRCWGCTKRLEVGSVVNYQVDADAGTISTTYWCDDCAKAPLRELGFWGDDCIGYGDIGQARAEEAREVTS